VEVGQREFPLDDEPGFLDSLGCKTAALKPRTTWRATKHELEVHDHEGGMIIYTSKPETRDKPNRHPGWNLWPALKARSGMKARGVPVVSGRQAGVVIKQ